MSQSTISQASSVLRLGRQQLHVREALECSDEGGCIPDEKCYTHSGDLQVLIETFPHCETEDLLLAIIEHPAAAASLLGEMPSNLLVGLACAIRDQELEAMGEAIALTAVLFTVHWQGREEFVMSVYPMLLEVLQWNLPDLEVWRDCLSVVSYAITILEIIDPVVMQWTIEYYIDLTCAEDDDMPFDDRERVAQFFLLVLAGHETSLRPDQLEKIHEILGQFLLD